VGGSINLTAADGGEAGNIDLSATGGGTGGNIRMGDNGSGNAGGSIDTSAGDVGSGGLINTSNGGGSIDTTAGGFLTMGSGNLQGPDWSGTITVLVTAPASGSDTGTAGQIAYDSSYLYVCVAANTWKRSALGTF
jgi:hypothetical protein